MRIVTAAIFVGALGTVMAVSAHSDSANAGPWCAYYDAYTSNCGFQTLEQCRATVFGDSDAYCQPNYSDSSSRRRRH